MRCSDLQITRELASQLLAYEQIEGTRAGSDTSAVVRVCDKVRRPVARLAGAAGFYSLLARALSLTKQEAPTLGAWEVKADGALQVPDGEAEQWGAVLVAHLLGLMMTFVGEALTLRHLQDAWPELPDYEVKAGEKESK